MHAALIELIRIHREKTAEELIRFAIASRLAGRPVEARANLELSIDKKPTFDAFVQLIEIAFEQERFTDAAELVAKARSLVESRDQRSGSGGLSASALSHRIARALESYKLLLQLEPDQDAGLNFGDGGTIYFCIDAADLAALRFEKARAILQLY